MIGLMPYRAVGLGLVSILILAGCDCDGPVVTPCGSDTECATDEVCRDGMCVTRPRIDAGDDVDAGEMMMMCTDGRPPCFSARLPMTTWLRVRSPRKTSPHSAEHLRTPKPGRGVMPKRRFEQSLPRLV